MTTQVPTLTDLEQRAAALGYELTQRHVFVDYAGDTSMLTLITDDDEMEFCGESDAELVRLGDVLAAEMRRREAA